MHCNNRNSNVFLHLQCVGVVLWPGTKFDVYARQFTFRSKIPFCVTSENVDGGTVVADPIVKKLFCNLRKFSDVNELKEEGMVPDRRLEFKSTIVSLVRSPMKLGIDPVSALPNKFIKFKEVMAPMELGIVPTKEFESMLNNLRDCSAPRLDGIVPFK